MSGALKRYLQTAGSSFTAKGVNAISGVLVLWLLNRLLSKSDFGTFMLVVTIGGVAASIVSAGFSQLLLFRVSRMDHTPIEMEIARAMLGKTLLSGLSLAVIFSIVLYLGAGPLEELSSNRSLSMWLIAACLMIPVDVAMRISIEWQRAVQKVRTAIMLGEVIPSLLRPLGLLILFAAAGSVNESPVLFGGIYAISFLVPFSWAIAMSSPRLRHLGPVFTKKDLMYGGKMSLTQMANQPARNVDVLLVGFLATAATTAEYVVVNRLALFLVIGLGALQQLLVPRMGYLLHKKAFETLQLEYDIVRTVGLMAGGMLTAGFILFAPYVLSFFGDYHASTALMILCVGVIVRIAWGMGGNYLGMAGYAGWTLTLTIVGMVTNAVFVILWFPRFGVNGAAAAFLLASVLQNGIIVWAAWREEKFIVSNRRTTLFLIGTGCLLLLFVTNFVSRWIAGTGLLFLVLALGYAAAGQFLSFAGYQRGLPSHRAEVLQRIDRR